MKKIVLFTLLLLCGANASAQLISFGPQVSSNISMARSKSYSDDKTGSGMNYGGFVRVNLLMFYAEGDLSYSQSKFSISADGTSRTEYELSGTDFTLLAGFKIVPLGKLGNVRVFAGYDWKNYSSIDTDNNLNLFAVEKNNNSFVIGAGVDVWKFTFDYRFLNGLTDIDTTAGDVKINQSCFVLGFKF